jgi:hypothetical protein
MAHRYNSGVERRVYWHVDGGWYDLETDVDIQNLTPSDLAAPSQSNDEQAQRVSDLIAVVREDWLPTLERKLTERLQGIARDEATRVLANATIPQFPAYFVEKQWLVNYEWAAYLAEKAEQRAVDRIRASFPRWLRWLIH